jgi:glucose/arabinose dehydrogenase
MFHPRLAVVAIVSLAAAGTSCNERTVEPLAETSSTATGTTGTSTAPNCTPVETRPPNAPDQRPVFNGQTRACAVMPGVELDVVVLAKGLEHPWAVEPLPGGGLLITERPGQMRIVSAQGGVGEPLEGLPAVDAQGQGGLLDVALGPGFQANRTIFWSFTEPRDTGNATSVARGVLSSDRRRLEQVRIIFRAQPAYDGDKHFGSRLVFGPDGMLYVTLGERSDVPMRQQAQQLDSHMGKILRITPDGAAPRDNPFVGQPGVLPEIWSLGHRNIQAAAFDPEGRLWAVEHGTQGGDEVNLIEKGENYGWPLVAYGEEYSGAPIPGAVTTREGFEDPIYYWDPVIAPSGAQLYTADAFPEWRGSLFIGSLKDRKLVRLTLDDERVTGEAHLLAERRQRIRDVRQGADGALYVVTDEDNGELWRIAPRRTANSRQ